MRLLESLRNRIETEPRLAELYARAGATAAAHALIMRRVRSTTAAIRRTRRYSVMIETTSLCNARCTFCPNHSLERKRGTMTAETFDQVVRRLTDERVVPAIVDLFGLGEPLLDPEIFARVRAVKRAFPAALVRLTTNLSLADEHMIGELLDSGLDSAHVSLNAADPTTYRRVMGLDWETTMAHVDELIRRRDARRSPLRIGLGMVLCRDNLGEQKRFASRWSSRVDALLLQRPADWGGTVAVESAYPAAMRLYPCRDLFERIVVLNDGRLALCAQDTRGLVGRSIADGPLLEAFDCALFRSMRAAHLNGRIGDLEQCRNCFGVHSNGAVWMFGGVERYERRGQGASRSPLQRLRRS